MEIKGKIYGITNTEFQILLVLCGIEHFYGVVVMDEKIEDKVLLKNLHNMVKKGILLCKEQVIQIQQPYQDMFAIIKEAKQSVFIEQKQNGNIRTGFGYFREKILWIESAKYQKRAFELQLFSVEEWMEYLLEEEYFPDYKTELSEELLQKLEEKKKTDSILNENWTDIQEKSDATGTQEKEEKKREQEKRKTKLSFRRLDEKTEDKWIGLYECFGIEWLVENNNYENQIPYKKAVWKERVLHQLLDCRVGA